MRLLLILLIVAMIARPQVAVVLHGAAAAAVELIASVLR